MKFLSDIQKQNNNILEIKKLGFTITNEDLPLEIGETKFDPDNETLVTRLTTVDYLRHGQVQFVKVRNVTGTLIPKGRAVYVTGGIGGSPILLVAPVNNDDMMQARRLIGITTSDIGNNSFGQVATSGVVEKLNTNSFEVGECMYVTTNGQYTNTPPTKPLITIRVGMVVRKNNNNGAILVFSRFLPNLDMLSNVKIENVQDEQVIAYDDDLGLWVNKDLNITAGSNATDVIYDNQDSGMLQNNVQDALDQIFFMFSGLVLEYDGGFSGSGYNESQNINGGDSVVQSTQIKQINGGAS